MAKEVENAPIRFDLFMLSKVIARFLFAFSTATVIILHQNLAKSAYKLDSTRISKPGTVPVPTRFLGIADQQEE